MKLTMTTRLPHAAVVDRLRELPGERTPAYFNFDNRREGHTSARRPVQLHQE